MSTWTHKYIATRVTPSSAGRIKATRTTVTAGLHKLDRNDRPYFSVTCSVEEQARNNRWMEAGGGADHDTIAAYWPKLAPVIALHLADDNGVPLHAIENALYHAGFSRFSLPHIENLANHLRILPVSAEGLIAQCVAAVGQDDTDPRAVMTAFVDGQRDRWQREARTAVDLLDELIAHQNLKLSSPK